MVYESRALFYIFLTRTYDSKKIAKKSNCNVFFYISKIISWLLIKNLKKNVNIIFLELFLI